MSGLLKFDSEHSIQDAAMKTASDRKRIRKLPAARKSKLPRFIAPQLATLMKEPPSGDEWLHELKFDGYRVLCRIDRGRVNSWRREFVIADYTPSSRGLPGFGSLLLGVYEERKLVYARHVGMPNDYHIL